jgi:hypothetical protein
MIMMMTEDEVVAEMEVVVAEMEVVVAVEVVVMIMVKISN